MKLTAEIILGVIQFLIGYNLILPIILYWLFSWRDKDKIADVPDKSSQADYGIIITAHGDVENLPHVVASILNMHYKNYLIYIVADCCDVSNLMFKDKRIIVLRPVHALNSNIKSHFYAIDNFKRNHERLTIIDSDNLVQPEYLNEINKYFNKGFSAVQGVRMAKNLNTNYACLDAARDIYYHFFDGKVIFNLGSSATLSGSGMAFDTELYKLCLKEHYNMIGAGFDKILQTELVVRDYQIAFAEKAIVYDEKTSVPEQLVKQRSRWIAAWFKYFKYGFGLIEQGVTKSSKNQFVFGFILIRPPLFIFLLVSLFCMAINLFVHPYFSLVWLVGFVLFVSGFAIALSKSDTNPKIYASLINIPAFMFYQVMSLLKLHNSGKDNIATKHYANVGLNEKL